MNFAVPTDSKGKMFKGETINKCLDLARELKKLWNMMLTVISVVAGALGTVPKSLEKRLEELKIRRRMEIIQHYNNRQRPTELAWKTNNNNNDNNNQSKNR